MLKAKYEGFFQIIYRKLQNFILKLQRYVFVNIKYQILLYLIIMMFSDKTFFFKILQRNYTNIKIDKKKQLDSTWFILYMS